MLYAMKDCANLTLEKATDEKVKLYTKYAKSTSIEFTSEQVYAKSKGVKAVRFDGDRGGTLKVSTEVFPMDIFPILFGSEIEEKSIPWLKREVLNVADGKVTLKETPKTGSLQVYHVKADDKVTNIKEQVAGSPDTAEDTYSISSSTLTFNTTTFPTNKKDGFVACYYFVDTTAKTFTVDSKTFPGSYIIYGDSVLKGTNKEDEFIQFKLYNAVPQSNASITMDVDNVCTLEITFDLLPNVDEDIFTWSYVE